jgi:A-macroglobulin TED domain
LFIDDPRKRHNVVLTANVAKLLSEAKEHIDVDESVIKETMAYVASQQQSDGHFSTNTQDSSRFFADSPNQFVIPTSSVLISLLESDSLRVRQMLQFNNELIMILDLLDQLHGHHR